MARRAGVYGPYKHGNKWRIVLRREGGGESHLSYEDEAAARRIAQEARQRLASEHRTVGGAVSDYKQHLVDKGNKQRSYEETIRRLRVFFPDETLLLSSVTALRCAARYEELTKRYAVDSHRNFLAEAKSFARWCVARGWWRTSPLEKIEGRGRRSHGKPQLRIDEARRWYRTAAELAGTEPGAVAALMAVTMGMRAGEIVSRTVRDLDDSGALLWIPEAKTKKGRRTLCVPDQLRLHLQRLAADRGAEEPLLGARHWRDWVRLWVQRICEQAGVPKVTAHSMRGLHSTVAMEQGVTSRVVADALGHESDATTLQSYVAPGAGGAVQQERLLKVLEGGRR